MCLPTSLPLLYPAATVVDASLRTNCPCLGIVLLGTVDTSTLLSGSVIETLSEHCDKVCAIQRQSIGTIMALSPTGLFSISGGPQWPWYGTAFPLGHYWSSWNTEKSCGWRARRHTKVTDFFKDYGFLLNQALMHLDPHMYWTLNKSTILFCQPLA